MLETFIISNRETILARARVRVAARAYPKASDRESSNGTAVFLDQLCTALRLAKSTDVIDHEQLSKSAGRHGKDLLRLGLSIAQVVRDYGDVCQVITQLAMDQDARIDANEFQTLNLCLDDAVANAVTEHTRHRERAAADESTERLGFLAHEMRNLLNTAALAFEMIKDGQVTVGGSTSIVLGRSLLGLRALLDRSLADVRLDAGIEHLERISVAEFMVEVEVGALIQAQARGVKLEVVSVEPTVTIEGDRQILEAAVSNLLQNAFKFTRKGGSVVLKARATRERVLFEIEDECGGLPPGNPEDLFRAFEQKGGDRSGIGLGLAICRKAAKANAGVINARDVPGKGCVFTLDLPRTPPLS